MLILKTVATFVHQTCLFWLLSGFCFDYSVHRCHFWLKTFNYWNKRDNGGMCSERKRNKCDFKLLRMDTQATTHRCKLFEKKNLTFGYQYCYFINFCEIKVCPKTWAYFTSNLGWLKISSGTNMGPPNNTYLSTPGRLIGFDFRESYILRNQLVHIQRNCFLYHQDLNTQYNAVRKCVKGY